MAERTLFLNETPGPHLGETLTSYCFGGLSDGKRDEVERHLMACDVCWGEFQHLDAAVRSLRFDRMLRPNVPVNEIVSLLGLSGRLNRIFAGHLVFAIGMALLFGAEWTVGIWSELGYSYDRFGRLAWELSLPVAGWSLTVLLLGLWLDVGTTRKGRSGGLLQSVLALLIGLGVLVAMLLSILPAERTIQASFQTRTAAGGFLKDAIVIFAPLLVFILPSFHAVVALQRLLAGGGYEQALNFFARTPKSLSPRGLIYLSPRSLGLILLVLGIMKVVGANHMLDALTPGPYAQLFSVAAYVSTGLWLAIALWSIAWLSTNLNELKREAVALHALQRGTERATEH